MRALLALGLMFLGLLAVVVPATPAAASGCHHNHVYATGWGNPFIWHDAQNEAWTLRASGLMFTGDSSSSCSDVNVTDVTAPCGTGAGFLYQKWNPGGSNYFAPEPASGPVPVTYGDSSLTVIKSGAGNSTGYRLDVFIDPSCQFQTLADTPILD